MVCCSGGLKLEELYLGTMIPQMPAFSTNSQLQPLDLVTLKFQVSGETYHEMLDRNSVWLCMIVCPLGWPFLKIR